MTKVIVDRELLRHAASVLEGVVHNCQPKPRQSYEDDTEYVGGQALEEASKVSDALDADAPSADEVVDVLESAVCPDCTDGHIKQDDGTVEWCQWCIDRDNLLTKLRIER